MKFSVVIRFRRGRDAVRREVFLGVELGIRIPAAGPDGERDLGLRRRVAGA